MSQRFAPRNDPRLQSVLDALVDPAKEYRTKDIMAATGLCHSTAEDRLYRLRREGKVELRTAKSGNGKYRVNFWRRAKAS